MRKLNGSGRILLSALFLSCGTSLFSGTPSGAVPAGLSSLLTAVPLAAQAPSPVVVESLMEEARFEEARVVLENWLEAGWANATRAEREHGLWLRALLTIDPAIAELDFRRIVLEYPGGRYSDEALFRLARASEAAGDVAAYRQYLEILMRDHPGSPLRVEARDRIERLGAPGEPSEAQTAERDGDPAVAEVPAVASGAPDAGEPVAEPEPRLPAAESEPAVEDPVPSPEPAVEEPVSAPAPEAQEAAGEPIAEPEPSPGVPLPDPPVGEYAVQLGAFSLETAARSVAGDPRFAGSDVRVVRVEGSDLYRVRMGSFSTREEAEAEVARLRSLGTDALVAGDRALESLVPR